MSELESCPARERLQALLDGELPPTEQDTIVRHVETCPACQQTLDSVSPAGRSWENLAIHLDRPNARPEPALQRVIDQALGVMGSDRTEAEQSVTPVSAAAMQEQTEGEARGAPADEDLTFLQPPTREGTIGRLGHYEVHAVIGKGGFGIVVKGFDERLHRVVAIKVLSPAYAASGSARKRFIREARAAAAVKNEHVVGIYDVQEEANPPYLVMEFIEGISLQDKLDRHGSLGVREILRIGMQAAEGLAAAHRQGLVHRDIKPANILLENGVERVKITDFGLARAVDDASLTQSGTVTGTPMYMSPEQAEGLAIDHRSDLFSLGTVLYALCTGHPPFRASGTHAVLKRVIDAAPRPIQEVNPEIPDWLCAIIEKLHAKNLEDRFQTAKEVADLLGCHLADVQAGRAEERRRPARAASPFTPAPDDPSADAPRRRSWVLVAVLLFLAVGVLLPLGLIGASIASYFWLSAPLQTGEFHVHWDDPTLVWSVQSDVTGETVFRNGSEQFRIAGDARISLPPGNYTLSVFKEGKPYHEEGVALSAGKTTSVVIPAAKDKAKPAAAPEDKEGWVQLFNGKNQNGWHTVSNEPGSWIVSDRVLIGTAGPRPLFTHDRTYRDFHLRMEADVSVGTDAGLFFRLRKPEVSLLRDTFQGYAVNITSRDTKKRAGALIRGLKKPEFTGEEVQIEPGDRFTVEVIARGNHLVARINGQTTADVRDPDNKYAEGYFGLRNFNTAMTIRVHRIEVNELPPGK
jgi:serine/threonine protein kinase